MQRNNYSLAYRQSSNYIFRNIARFNDVVLFNESMNEFYNCGTVNQCCPFCKALFFNCERNSKGVYTICCNNGAVILPRMSKPTKLTQDLLSGYSEKSKLFLKSPRYYNSQLSFASITMKEGKYCISSISLNYNIIIRHFSKYPWSSCFACSRKCISSNWFYITST